MKKGRKILTEGKEKRNSGYGIPDIDEVGPVPPPPRPTFKMEESEKTERIKKYRIERLIATDIKAHEAKMNEMYEIGYVFHSSYALGGNEVALRFVLK